ncbi:MAG: DUF6065 family protein [Bauldia sp.]
MELVCYTLRDDGLEIRPASHRRDWMDATAFPYRCLPLVIANGFGWEILVPSGITAIWNGGPAVDGVVVMADDEARAPASSHFGAGILTFSLPAVFRTDPGTDLIVQGPVNRPKDAIAPLTGVVESDWGPFSFTMNWKFTRPNTAVRFRKGEPICHILPVRRGTLEAVQPRIASVSIDPELEATHRKWRAAREQFNTDLKIPGSAAETEKWQKHYQRGVEPDGKPGSSSHRLRTQLQPFLPLSAEAPDRSTS